MIVPPALFGHELAGTIEASGAGSARLQEGDARSAESARAVSVSTAPNIRGICVKICFQQRRLCRVTSEFAPIVETNMLVVPAKVSF